jgi:hypothetical protein
MLNDIDKQIILKLFDLSINRYSEVSGTFSHHNFLIYICQIRRKAQYELFDMLHLYRFSFQIIVDRIVEILSTPAAVSHDQIKVYFPHYFFTSFDLRII